MLPVTLMVHHFLVRSFDVLLFVAEVCFVGGGLACTSLDICIEGSTLSFPKPFSPSVPTS